MGRAISARPYEWAAAIGGGNITATCAAGVLVDPVPGDAVLFYNFEPEGGTVDPAAVHAACEVTSGVKWAANHWFNLPEHSAGEYDSKSEL
jgi:prolyl 4-hydroxylase